MISELNIFKAFTFSQNDQQTAVSIKVSDPTISKIELRDFEKLESLDLTEINQNILLTIENCPKLSFVNLPFIQEEHQIEYKCRSSSEKDEYQCIIRGKMTSFLFQMIDQEKEKILFEEMICATNEKPLKHVLIGNTNFLKKIHQSCDDFSIYCLQIYQAQENQYNLDQIQKNLDQNQYNLDQNQKNLKEIQKNLKETQKILDQNQKILEEIQNKLEIQNKPKILEKLKIKKNLKTQKNLEFQRTLEIQKMVEFPNKLEVQKNLETQQNLETQKKKNLEIQQNLEEQTYQLALKTPFLILMTDYHNLLFPNQIDMMSLYLNNCKKITYYETCSLLKIKGNQSVSMIDYQLKNTEIINEIQNKQDTYQMLLNTEIEKKREYEFTQQQVHHVKEKKLVSFHKMYHTITDHQLMNEETISELKQSFKTMSEVQISILNERKYEIRSKMKFLNLFQKIELINCQLDHLEIKSNFIPLQINLFNTTINEIQSQFLKSAYADETSKILSFDLNQTDVNFSYHVDQKNPTLVDLKGSLFENHQKYLSRYHRYFDLAQDDDMSQMVQLFDQMTEAQKLNHLHSIGHITETPIDHFKNLKFLYLLVKKDPHSYSDNIWEARIRAMNHFHKGEKKENWLWLVPKEYQAEAYLIDLHLVLRLYHLYPPAKAWFDQYLYSFVLPIQISTLIEILLPIEQEDGSASIFEPLAVNAKALYYEILNHISLRGCKNTD